MWRWQPASMTKPQVVTPARGWSPDSVHSFPGASHPTVSRCAVLAFLPAPGTSSEIQSLHTVRAWGEPCRQQFGSLCLWICLVLAFGSPAKSVLGLWLKAPVQAFLLPRLLCSPLQLTRCTAQPLRLTRVWHYCGSTQPSNNAEPGRKQNSLRRRKYWMMRKSLGG